MNKQITQEAISEESRRVFIKRYSGFTGEQLELDRSTTQSREAFKKGAEWAVKELEPKWISIEERLPKRDADVYFYRLGTSEYVYEGKYVGNGFFEQGKIRYDQTVTHFLEKVKPLPPSQEKGEPGNG